MDRRITRASVVCLACGLNPLARADFDGLCVSCRGAVAGGLYRVQWIYPEGSADRVRVIEFATAGEHPLGAEYPDHPDPIPYRPERLPELWRAIEAAEADENRAALTLERLTHGV